MCASLSRQPLARRRKVKATRFETGRSSLAQGIYAYQHDQLTAAVDDRVTRYHTLLTPLPGQALVLDLRAHDQPGDSYPPVAT